MEREEAEFLAESLRFSTGLQLREEQLSGRKRNSVDFVLNPGRSDLGEEGYCLKITHDQVVAEAAATAGLHYAAQTLRQLLPPQAFAKKTAAGIKWSLPCLKITDVPRFPWRGMHLDVSRHFYPVDFIRRYIDLLALHKMNVFHWHLVDDGGWRMESRKYPLLTQRGAWRSSPPKGKWDYAAIVFPEKREGTEYGGSHAQEEIRDIVRYAAQRHVTVMPEIEIPGHTWPSISSYPELGCDLPAGFRPRGGPGNNVYCAGKEEAFRFLEDILEETMELFPSEYIHIGGDEVDKTFWRLCPRCKARMEAEGLKDADELQSYFIRRIDRFLSSKGRKLVGWDEILEGGLAEGATVMSWRGVSGGIEAVRQGKRAIMGPTSHCYFDYPYTSIPTEAVYLYEPVPAEVTEHASSILGAQGNVWSEWMPESSDVERMAFPRVAALAEAVWSAKEGRSLAGFLDRLSHHYSRLDQLDVRYKVPSPQTDYDAILFEKSASISFSPSPIRGLQIHYTTNGAQPTSQSPVLRKRIRITADTDVTAALFRPDGVAGDVTMVSCRKQRPQHLSQLEPGSMVSYYEGKWNRVPDFRFLTAAGQQVALTIDNSFRQRSEGYALRFAGLLRVPQDGVYTFTLSSDDGSWLRVGGATVVDHDGPHATSAKSGRVVLKEGAYPLEIGYFQAGGDASLAVWIEGPGIPRQPLAGGMLLREQVEKQRSEARAREGHLLLGRISPDRLESVRSRKSYFCSTVFQSGGSTPSR